MFAISIYTPEVLSLQGDGLRGRHPKFRRSPAPCSMMMEFRPFQARKKEVREISVQLPGTSVPLFGPTGHPDLQFDRLQVPEKELIHEDKLEFGQFVAREAVIDEEYWTAAWLRAESHWEDGVKDRYLDNHKRKFAEQEFQAIKRRRVSLHGQRCKCIVTVRKEDKSVKRTVLKSVVGTLDLSVRCLLHGETFPGERVKPPIFCGIGSRGPNRYGYVANLCVSKSARRQGIASNMLYFAINSARSSGIEDVYVHVHKKNQSAQDLYNKMGFEIVDTATTAAQLAEEQTYLLCCRA